MKLRNKKNGEIVDLSEGFIRDTYSGNMIQIKPVAISNKEGYMYDSLAELNDDWEDYEESKEYWVVDYITAGVDCLVYEPNDPEVDDFNKEIGNYFETKEEAEKAVDKLKAWKRLKDKGFRFEGYDRNYNHWHINFTFDNYCTGEPHSASDDLDLLFGGEE